MSPMVRIIQGDGISLSTYPELLLWICTVTMFSLSTKAAGTSWWLPNLQVSVLLNLKAVPEIVTRVPPRVGPETGERVVSVGREE